MPISAWIIAFLYADTFCHAVTLTFDPLTLVHQPHMIKVCTKYEQNRTIPGWIIDNFAEFLHTLCRAVTLTFDLLTLNFYSTSGVMGLNFVHNLSEMD